MMQGQAWEYSPIEAQRFLCLKELSSDRIALEDSAIADDEPRIVSVCAGSAAARTFLVVT